MRCGCGCQSSTGPFLRVAFFFSFRVAARLGTRPNLKFGAQACLNRNEEKKLPTVTHLRNHLHKESDDSASKKRSRRTCEDPKGARWGALRDTLQPKKGTCVTCFRRFLKSSARYSFSLWQPFIGPLGKKNRVRQLVDVPQIEPFNQQEGKGGYGNNSFPGAATGFFSDYCCLPGHR